MPKVSIIVPMYNSAKYLRRCVESLINQTLRDIEIILVNDASPDNSLEIARSYEVIDVRVRVIDIPNNIVASRNWGIQIATGEYLGFVDADDWVEPDMYEKLYQASEGGEIDVVIGGIQECYQSGKKIEEKSVPAHLCENKELFLSYYAEYGGRLFTNIWKRKMITEDIYFKEHNLYCDSIVCAWYLKANSYKKVDSIFYNYYINDNSITHVRNSDKVFDRLSSADDMMDRIKVIGLYSQYPEVVDYIYYRLYFKNTLLTLLFNFTKLPCRKILQLRDAFMDKVKIENNPYFLKNRNKKGDVLSRVLMKNSFCGIAILEVLSVGIKIKRLLNNI